jgi:DNA polymerase III epsilon subunit family exonuclease
MAPAADLIITPRTVRPAPPGVPGLLTRAPFVAVDVETSGVGAHSRIIEVGAVKMNHRGEILDKYESITNPGRGVPLNPAAQRVHGITSHMVWSAPPIETVLEELREFIGWSGVVAHNLSFENRFFTAEYKELPSEPPAWQGICTLASARKFVTSESFKLERLLTLLDIDAVNDHRAVTDAQACGMLLARLIDQCNVADLEPLKSPQATAPGRAHIAILKNDVSADTHADVRRTAGRAAQREALVRSAFGGFAPTAEQQAVLDAFGTGNNVVVRALAGTGKTSTLLGIARIEAAQNPLRRGLYLAFNKAVAKEADAMFPDQVHASTVHALALKHMGKTSYGPLLAKLDGGRATFREIATEIRSTQLYFSSRSDGPAMLAQYPITRLALATVERFCITMDTEIGAHHVPALRGIESRTAHREELVGHVLPIARRAWRALLDPHNWTIKFTPSHYLKLWADLHPKVGEPDGFILFDEAQDANPLLRSIIQDQTHLQRVYVGDENQAIYRFTGAQNAMNDLPAVTNTSLTQSWRFGPVIADAANEYLRALGSFLRVHGNPGVDARLIDSAAPVDAVLCRTNGAALKEVMTAQTAGKKTALIGDTAAAVRFCESAEELKAGRTPRDADLAAFQMWGELQEYVEHSPGAGDLKTLVELVDSYGIGEVKNAMETTVPVNRAEAISATCHKAKGLEFRRVRINYDWEIDDHPEGSPDELRDERMLAYVALTRAKEQLDPGQLLEPATILRINGNHGHRPTPEGLPTAAAGQLL